MNTKKEDLIKRNKEEYDYDQMSWDKKLLYHLENSTVVYRNHVAHREVGGLTIIDRVETRKRFPDNSSE